MGKVETDSVALGLRVWADYDARAGEPLGKRMREAADAIEAKDAEIARLQALVDEAVNLILGDLVGAEWKQACRAFVKRATLPGQLNV